MPRVGNITYQWDHHQFAGDLEAIVRARLRTVGAFVRSEVIKLLRPGRTRQSGPAGAGQPPHSDTGRLRQSIQWQVGGPSNRPNVIIGSDVVYSLTLELGGTITPKTARALAVPVSEEARAHRRRGGGPRDFPKQLVLIARPGRPPLLVETMARRWVIHYVLPPKVTIPPHPFLRPALMGSRAGIQRIFETGSPNE